MVRIDKFAILACLMDYQKMSGRKSRGLFTKKEPTKISWHADVTDVDTTDVRRHLSGIIQMMTKLMSHLIYFVMVAMLLTRNTWKKLRSANYYVLTVTEKSMQRQNKFLFFYQTSET